MLLGMARPVHVLQRGVEVSDIVNMAAICVVDAQELAAPGLHDRRAPLRARMGAKTGKETLDES